ncbi:uncharacterized protein B0I36DRAFT_331960 [Microdochium trichocladiopsis]|uniref:Uncharacterized protein n=1 Tax=Microdochium trichocladiopsis TaxID=1682393 RepID=A0A9P9BIY5_9PEZI|nr:uncharacterized protein B0I36DRAFT_331960 [Microdochium trichocladiopsis]KAH7024728.1 hypothetical protein B0I36DRAFT_331960 [Microdochium trichocladiopsis]
MHVTLASCLTLRASSPATTTILTCSPKVKFEGPDSLFTQTPPPRLAVNVVVRPISDCVVLTEYATFRKPAARSHPPRAPQHHPPHKRQLARQFRSSPETEGRQVQKPR